MLPDHILHLPHPHRLAGPHHRRPCPLHRPLRHPSLAAPHSTSSSQSQPPLSSTLPPSLSTYDALLQRLRSSNILLHHPHLKSLHLAASLTFSRGPIQHNIFASLLWISWFYRIGRVQHFIKLEATNHLVDPTNWTRATEFHLWLPSYRSLCSSCWPT